MLELLIGTMVTIAVGYFIVKVTEHLASFDSRVFCY